MISKLHMTRVLGFGNNDRSTVPPTLQVVEISPVLPHDSANVGRIVGLKYADMLT